MGTKPCTSFLFDATFFHFARVTENCTSNPCINLTAIIPVALGKPSSRVAAKSTPHILDTTDEQITSDVIIAVTKYKAEKHRIWHVVLQHKNSIPYRAINVKEIRIIGVLT